MYEIEFSTVILQRVPWRDHVSFLLSTVNGKWDIAPKPAILLPLRRYDVAIREPTNQERAL